MRISVFLLLATLLMSPVHADPTDAQRLHELFAERWEAQLRDNPEAATYLGDRRFDDRLTDLSDAAWKRRRAANRETLARIEAIDRAKLSEADRLNYDLFRILAVAAVEGDRFPHELAPLNQMGGIYSLLGELAQQIPRDAVRDHENFLARMRSYPRAVDETIALMKRGLAAGVTPSRAIVGGVAELIGNQIVENPVESPVYQLAFASFRSSIPADEQTRLRKEALEVLRTAVIPSLRKLHQFWVKEYYPATRESIAWTSVPDGDAWYAFLVREQTTTDMTPNEIHALGLSEVRRIRNEMESVMKTSGFGGTLDEFFVYLRTDPKFFHQSREELLAAYREISKRIDPELTRLFRTMPRLPYGVVPIPEYSEKTQTTAYYWPGSPEANRPGYYFVNLYDLKSRPKWEMEALSLHEAVPGHHFQIALAQELTDVPLFRRWGTFTAYVEGWGLYAESLGPELGMYTDPYSKFGQLTYEMWRAVRLVVDTGMHAKGWTREEAIGFFASNSSKPMHDIEVEINRYIAWPGQALAYKIGELKIKELRARGEKELGEQFDIRGFHDTLLGAGPLPLSLLETRMNEWIGRQKGAAKATITIRQ
ncbi:MAG TPA: DUF885 domain-containing protein [Thermoanaerobaculia bacterium]